MVKVRIRSWGMYYVSEGLPIEVQNVSVSVCVIWGHLGHCVLTCKALGINARHRLPTSQFQVSVDTIRFIKWWKCKGLIFWLHAFFFSGVKSSQCECLSKCPLCLSCGYCWTQSSAPCAASRPVSGSRWWRRTPRTGRGVRTSRAWRELEEWTFPSSKGTTSTPAPSSWCSATPTWRWAPTRQSIGP